MGTVGNGRGGASLRYVAPLDEVSPPSGFIARPLPFFLLLSTGGSLVGSGCGLSAGGSWGVRISSAVTLGRFGSLGASSSISWRTLRFMPCVADMRVCYGRLRPRRAADQFEFGSFCIRIGLTLRDLVCEPTCHFSQ